MVGRTLSANSSWLAQCVKRHRGRPLNSVVRVHRAMKTLSWLAGVAVVLLAIGFGHIGGRSLSDHLFPKSSPDALLKSTVAEINKQTPVMLDAYTRFDSAVVLPNRALAYNYTLVGMPASSINSTQLAAIEQNVVQTTCEQQEQNLLSKGIALTFRYRSADSLVVKEVLIKPKSCIYDPFTKSYGVVP